MIPPENLLALVVECERAGGRLYLGESGAVMIAGLADLPIKLVGELKNSRDAIGQYLRECTPKEADPVRFVAKNLDYRDLPAGGCRGSKYVELGDRVFWRLTPGVCWWMWNAVIVRVERCTKDGSDLSWYGAAESALRELMEWTFAHYWPHELQRAEVDKPSLPTFRREI